MAKGRVSGSANQYGHKDECRCVDKNGDPAPQMHGREEVAGAVCLRCGLPPISRVRLLKAANVEIPTWAPLPQLAV